jgi:hypothetical protein
MADEGKRLIVDDDWKDQARREKEKLAEKEAATKREAVPEPSFGDLLNLVAIQAMVGLGMLTGPGGEQMPPNLDVAKHFVDLLAVLELKTRNNLTPEEKRLLDAVTYDLRMRFVEVAQALGAAGPAAATPGEPAPA